MSNTALAVVETEESAADQALKEMRRCFGASNRAEQVYNNMTVAQKAAVIFTARLPKSRLDYKLAEFDRLERVQVLNALVALRDAVMGFRSEDLTRASFLEPEITARVLPITEEDERKSREELESQKAELMATLKKIRAVH